MKWIGLVIYVTKFVVFADLVYRKSGNITITGIFNTRECKVATGKELQEMASVIWTTEALNNYRYVSGMTIGLSLYKICGEINPEDVISLIEDDLNRNEESINVGILTSSEIFKKVQPLKGIQNKRMARPAHVIGIDMLVDLTVQLLTNIQWKVVDAVVGDSENVLSLFSEKTSLERICVRDELLITDRKIWEKSDLNETNTVVVIAEFFSFQKILPVFRNQTLLVLVPTDFTFNQIEGLPKHTIVLLPSISEAKGLFQYIKNGKYQRDVFNHREPTKSPLFIGVAATILKLLQSFKNLDRNCHDINFISKKLCSQVFDFMDNLKANKTILLPQISTGTSFNDITNALKVLKINSSPNDEMFLYIASLTKGNDSEDFGIFQILNFQTRTFQPILLKINDNLLEEGLKRHFECDKQAGTDLGRDKEFSETNTDSKSLIKLLQSLTSHSIGNLKRATEQPNASNVFEVCDFANSTCRNFERNLTKPDPNPVVWRFLTWVSINTSVGFMGFACTLSIAFFILSRICKNDILEGSPYFTLLLMFAVILIFFSSVAYHMDIPEHHTLICNVRKSGPPLVYAILFSLLLSRSLMLASNDSTGFVNHINGYIQSILCLFMLGVQLSFLYQDLMHSDSCSNIHSHYDFMISLGYDFLLLTILACISPFTIRSKRNYKEGLLFSICVFFIILVWSAWISLYFLLDLEQREAAVACGLNSTGIVVLLCVFIPRTYLMAAAIVRDRTARSLPSLDRNILTETSDVNYKSNQTLNDSVFGTITYKNSEMGVSSPNFCARRSIESRETAIENLN